MGLEHIGKITRFTAWLLLRWLLVGATLAGLVLVAAVILSSPDQEPRPTEDDVAAEFTSRYGKEAKVSNIRVSEDEVTARSFEIQYQKRETMQSGTITMYFTSGADGKWRVAPPMPERLP